MGAWISINVRGPALEENESRNMKRISEIEANDRPQIILPFLRFGSEKVSWILMVSLFVRAAFGSSMERSHDAQNWKFRHRN